MNYLTWLTSFLFVMKLQNDCGYAYSVQSSPSIFPRCREGTHLRFGLSCVFEYGLVWLLLQAGRDKLNMLAAVCYRMLSY